MEYIEITLIIIILIIIPSSLILFWYLNEGNKNGFPTNWPIVGMLPALVKNLDRFHLACIEILEKSNLTFEFMGPWFSNVNFLCTLHPANVHYVMNENFSNYPKGNKFRDIFDFLGDGIFNADFQLWEYHRRIILFFIRHQNFHRFLVNKTWDKLQNGLIPVFDHAAKHAIHIDLQNLFAR